MEGDLVQPELRKTDIAGITGCVDYAVAGKTVTLVVKDKAKIDSVLSILPRAASDSIYKSDNVEPRLVYFDFRKESCAEIIDEIREKYPKSGPKFKDQHEGIIFVMVDPQTQLHDEAFKFNEVSSIAKWAPTIIIQTKDFSSLEDPVKTMIGEHTSITYEVGKEYDKREINGVLNARSFVKSLGLNRASSVVSIGTGVPNDFFWPNMPSRLSSNYSEPTIHTAWERLMYDEGANVHIFESDDNAMHNWQSVATHAPSVKKGPGILDINGDFNNTNLPPNSVDVIVMNNLFGTPTLIADTDASLKIVDNMGRLVKNGGYIIVGNSWPGDERLSNKRLDHLRKSGVQLEVAFKDEKAKTPWIAYKVIK